MGVGKLIISLCLCGAVLGRSFKDLQLWFAEGNLTLDTPPDYLNRTVPNAEMKPAERATKEVWIRKGAAVLALRKARLQKWLTSTSREDKIDAWEDIASVPRLVRRAVNIHKSLSSLLSDTPVSVIADVDVRMGVPEGLTSEVYSQRPPVFGDYNASGDASVQDVTFTNASDYHAVRRVMVRAQSLSGTNTGDAEASAFSQMQNVWTPVLMQHGSEMSHLLHHSRSAVPLYGAFVAGVGFVPAPTLVSCYTSDVAQLDGAGYQDESRDMCVVRGMERVFSSSEEAYAALTQVYAQGAAAAVRAANATLRRSLQAVVDPQSADELIHSPFLLRSLEQSSFKNPATRFLGDENTAGSRNLFTLPQMSSGVQSMLLVRFKFYGQADTVAMSASGASALASLAMSDTTRSSFGVMTYAITVPSVVYQVPSNIATCPSDINSVSEALISVIRSGTPAYDPLSFQRYHLLVPSCNYGWSGLAQTPGSRTWLNGGTGTDMIGVLMHEGNHNAGLNHASASDFFDGTWTEYTETGDFMGIPDPYDQKDYEAGYKHDLRWIPDSSVLTFGPGDGEARSATFSLGAIDRGTLNSNAAYMTFRVRHAASAAVSTTFGMRYVYATYRFRLQSATNGILLNDVPLHMSTTGNSLVVDPAPYTSSFSDLALTVNQAFVYVGGVSRYLMENLGAQRLPATSTNAGDNTLTMRVSLLDANNEPVERRGCVGGACQPPVAATPITLPCLSSPSASGTIALNLSTLMYPSVLDVRLSDAASSLTSGFVRMQVCQSSIPVATSVRMAAYEKLPLAEMLTLSSLSRGSAMFVGEALWRGTAWDSSCKTVTVLASKASSVFVAMTADIPLAARTSARVSLSVDYQCIPPVSNNAPTTAAAYQDSHLFIKFSNSYFDCEYVISTTTPIRNGKLQYDCAGRFNIIWVSSTWRLTPWNSFNSYYATQADAAGNLLALTTFGSMTINIARVCPVGSFFAASSTACVACPANSRARIGGSQASNSVTSACFCTPGYYMDTVNAVCAPCGANTYKEYAGNAASACVACPAGYQSQPGSTFCAPPPVSTPWAACSTLYFQNFHPYFAGSFTLLPDVDHGRLMWMRNTPGLPVRYILFATDDGRFYGQDSPTSGSYYFVISSMRLPQYWTAAEWGSYSSGFAQCVAERYGTYNAKTSCPAGQQPDAKLGKCVDCPVGAYRASSYNTTTAQGLCSACGAGTTTSTVGLQSCDVAMCAGCAACPSGYSYTSTGATTRQCTDINECTMANGGCSHTCQNTPGGLTCGCPAGMVLDSTGKTCVNCGPSTFAYTDGAGRASCVSCSAVNNAQGDSDSKAACVCPAGYIYSSATGACKEPEALMLSAVDVPLSFSGTYERCNPGAAGSVAWRRTFDQSGSVASTDPLYIWWNAAYSEWSVVDTLDSKSGRYAYVLGTSLTKAAALSALSVTNASMFTLNNMLPFGTQPWRMFQPYPVHFTTTSVRVTWKTGVVGVTPGATLPSCVGAWQPQAAGSPQPSGLATGASTPSPAAPSGATTPSAAASASSAATTSPPRASTPSQSATASTSMAASASASSPASPSGTRSMTPSGTATASPSVSSSGTSTPTRSQSSSRSGTATPTSSASNSGSSQATATQSTSGSISPSFTSTPSSSISIGASPSNSGSVSGSSHPTSSATSTGSGTPSPTFTPTQTSSGSPSGLPSASASSSGTPEPSSSATVSGGASTSATPDSTSSPLASPSGAVSNSNSPSPSATPSPSSSATPKKAVGKLHLKITVKGTAYNAATVNALTDFSSTLCSTSASTLQKQLGSNDVVCDAYTLLCQCSPSDDTQMACSLSQPQCNVSAVQMSMLTQDADYDTWSTVALADPAARQEFITQVASTMSTYSGSWDPTLLQGSTTSPLEAAPADSTPTSPSAGDHKSFPLVMIIVMVAVVLVVLTVAVAVWRYRRSAPAPRPRPAAVQRVNPLQSATRSHAASSSVVPQASSPAHARPRLRVPE